MRSPLRRLLALVPVAALVVGGAVLLDADPAEAFGYNRAVSRACGENWVDSSGTLAEGSARTSHYSGSCNDVLGAAVNIEGIGVVWSNGSGPRGAASIHRTNLGDTTGRHRGCPTCAVTLS